MPRVVAVVDDGSDGEMVREVADELLNLAEGDLAAPRRRPDPPQRVERVPVAA